MFMNSVQIPQRSGHFLGKIMQPYYWRLDKSDDNLLKSAVKSDNRGESNE